MVFAGVCLTQLNTRHEAGLLAGVLAGRTASDTLGQAVSFISEVSYKTQRLGTPPREGVVFENELYRLI